MRVHIRVTPPLSLDDMSSVLRLREEGSTVVVLGDRHVSMEPDDPGPETWLRKNGYICDKLSARDEPTLPVVPILERVL
jgi:hypothetical protein